MTPCRRLRMMGMRGVYGWIRNATVALWVRTAREGWGTCGIISVGCIVRSHDIPGSRCFFVVVDYVLGCVILQIVNVKF